MKKKDEFPLLKYALRDLYVNSVEYTKLISDPTEKEQEQEALNAAYEMLKDFILIVESNINKIFVDKTEIKEETHTIDMQNN